MSITVMVIGTSEGDIQIRSIGPFPKTLEDLQDAVGGYIEELDGYMFGFEGQSHSYTRHTTFVVRSNILYICVPTHNSTYAYLLLVTACYWFLYVHYLPLVTCYLLSASHYLLHTACYVMLNVCYMELDTYRLLLLLLLLDA